MAAGATGQRTAGAPPECPPWLKQAASIPLTPAQSAEPAIVLVDDLSATVADDGTITNHRMYAARVQTHEGVDAAVLREWYSTDTGKVRQVRGWIIRPSGEVQELDKRRVLDLALAANDVYNEARLRVISAGEVEPGTIFGAEVVSEDRSVFGQTEWPLQERWAVRSVVRRLTVPSGWNVSAVTFNHAAIQPTVTGTTSTWSARDIPAIDDESHGLPVSSLAGRLAVSYGPSRASVTGAALFPDWQSVSRWLAAISDQQAEADASIIAKTRELTTGATSDADRIRAIAAYVQRVQYISIQMGLGRGGGYRPRPASLVFARNHGDCKDKANLMRAMLRAVGIQSYLVSVFAGDRMYVRDEWPSPQQFNHCILAIALGSAAGVLGPTVETPALGRLLIFDPTAEYTPVGALPGADQGSLALIVSAENGALVRLPEGADDANGFSRAVEGTIAADGGFAARVLVRARGDVGAAERSAAEGVAPAEYQQLFERRVSSDITGVRVTRLDTKKDGGAFEISMGIEAARYGQTMQSRLIVFTPPFHATERIPALAGATRKGPAAISGVDVVDTLRLELPAGFGVDELPQASNITSPFGTYTLAARLEDGRVVVERRCTLKRAVVPVSEYAALRAFFDKARAADSSPIVLQRR